MIVNLCHACRRVNAPTAQRCDACGCDLGEHDTWPSPLSRLAVASPDTALWLNDMASAPRAAAGGRRAPEAELPALDISLRDLDVPPLFARALGSTADAGPASQAPAAPPPPLKFDLPPQAHWAPTPAPTPVPAPAPAPAVVPAAAQAAALADTDSVARAAWKVARRGGVRRSRLARAAPVATDVLVLDPDDTARHQLSSLLRAFGFNVRSAASVPEAAALATEQAFVAAFFDVALDGIESGASLALLRHVGESAQRHGAPATLLVFVAAGLRPVDRVRAELAGFDEVLAKPLSRGGVARVLDSRGVALPSDARRV
jgi:CheY-like chemotaxis protein